MNNENAVIVPEKGFILIVLVGGIVGVLGDRGIEFNADYDSVAEHCVMSGREDLISYLKHVEIKDVETIDAENGETVQMPTEFFVQYTPQGRRVEKLLTDYFDEIGVEYLPQLPSAPQFFREENEQSEALDQADLIRDAEINEDEPKIEPAETEQSATQNVQAPIPSIPAPVESATSGEIAVSTPQPKKSRKSNS